MPYNNLVKILARIEPPILYLCLGLNMVVELRLLQGVFFIGRHIKSNEDDFTLQYIDIKRQQIHSI